MSITHFARAVGFLFVTASLAGCGQHIYNLRVPLSAPAQTTAAQGANIQIDDQRAAPEREVHLGGRWRCERWYGDDTYVPPKLDYLKQLLAAHAPAGAALHVKLERFDTVEYCENTANNAAAAGAYGAASATANGGVAVYFPPTTIPLGDSVLIRLHGEINGVPFAVQRQFDYSDLHWRFTEMPAANAEYRARFERAMEQLADEIVARASAPPGHVPAN